MQELSQIVRLHRKMYLQVPQSTRITLMNAKYAHIISTTAKAVDRIAYYSGAIMVAYMGHTFVAVLERCMSV